MSHLCVYVFMAVAPWLIPGQTERTIGLGEASARALSSSAGQSVQFKVVVWYLKSDPIGTFKYEVYDLRIGQYTPKVDEWVNDVQKKYPGYFVAVRAVDLHREKGDTEFLKVGSVIRRDLVVAAASVGITLESGATAPIRPSTARIGRFLELGEGPRTAVSRRQQSLRGLPASPRNDRGYLTPVDRRFPVPVPFPHLPR